MSTHETPLKILEGTKGRIRYVAALEHITMGEFVEKAVAEYLDDGEDMLEANETAIKAGEPIPYPVEAYEAELRHRRTSSSQSSS